MIEAVPLPPRGPVAPETPARTGPPPVGSPFDPRATLAVPSPGAPAQRPVAAPAGLPTVPRYALGYIRLRCFGAAMSEAARALGSTASAKGSRWRVAQTEERWHPEVTEAIQQAEAAGAAAKERYLVALEAKARS